MLVRTIAAAAAATFCLLAPFQDAAAQSVSQERQRMNLESAQRSVDRANDATLRSLQRSERDITDRTVRSMDTMRLRSESRPLYVPTQPRVGNVR